MSGRYFDNDRDFVDEIYQDYEDDYPIRPYSADNVDSLPYEDEDPIYYDDGEYQSFTDEYPADWDDLDSIPERNPNQSSSAYKARMENVPFHGGTTYQSHYPWKDPMAQRRKSTPAERVLPPFYSDTTHKADFNLKIPKPAQSFKPKRGGLSSDIPFYGETSHKADYVPMKQDKVRSMKKSTYFGAAGDFHDATTHKTEYGHKKAVRERPLRVRSAPLFPRGIENHNTTHQASYLKVKGGNCPAEAILNRAKGGRLFKILHLMLNRELWLLHKRSGSRGAKTLQLMLNQEL
ncbi:unnamed protein product, partial [Mesorhabditis spiculigera]